WEACRVLARCVTRGSVFSDKLPSLAFVPEQSRGRQRAVLYVARELDRIKDLLVAGAAADIAAKPLLDLLAIGERIGAQRRGRRHHHAGDAVAALAGTCLVEGLLQRAELAGLCQRLDGLDGPL